MISVIGARLFESASTASVRKDLSVGWSLASDSATAAFPAARASRYALTDWSASVLAGGGAVVLAPGGADPPGPPVAVGSTGGVVVSVVRLTRNAAPTPMMIRARTIAPTTTKIRAEPFFAGGADPPGPPAPGWPGCGG